VVNSNHPAREREEKKKMEKEEKWENKKAREKRVLFSLKTFRTPSTLKQFFANAIYQLSVYRKQFN
jgi:hypothetical protein